MKQAQLEGLARQAARGPIPLMLAAGLVGFTVHSYVPWWQVTAWIAAIALVSITRWRYAASVAGVEGGSVDRPLRNMTILSLCGGIAAGSGALLFLPQLATAERAIVTMLMVSWAAGAVSTNAAYSRTYFTYAVPMVAPIIALWVLGGTLENFSVALLIALFVALQAGFVRDNERIFRASFDIRYQNERLIRELQIQRQAVIHERDRAEDANRAKSRFLAAASHDLRQPLHAISLYSASLSVRAADERIAELAARINTGIASLGSLLDGLLDISKLDAEAVQPQSSAFAIDALVSRLAADFRPVALAKGLRLDSRCPEGLLVETDSLLLERILRNLLDNAVKYTLTGGITLQVSAEQERVLISVADTGVGIPEPEQERVFEEFYQLSNPERDRSRGLGLGLAIVQRLSRLLDIDLRLRSRTGEGSTFTLSLRRAHQPLQALEAAGDAASEDDRLQPGLHVLIVDDEAEIRRGMELLLGSWGCRVSAVADVQSAMAALAAGSIDVLVADSRLRGAETGVALASAARAQYQVPVLLVTGDTDPERLREATMVGLTLLHKPVSERDLRKHIAAAFRQSKRATSSTPVDTAALRG